MSTLIQLLRTANHARINTLRIIRLSIIHWLVLIILTIKHFVKRNNTTINKIKNVVILMHGKGIGDAIISTGFIKFLYDQNVKVYVIAEPRLSIIYQKMVPECAYIELSKHFLIKDRTVSNECFDVLVNPYDKDRGEVYVLRTMLRLQYKFSITFNRKTNIFYSKSITDTTSEHFSNRYIKLLDILSENNKKFIPYNYHLVIPFSAHERVSNFAKKSLRPIIVINGQSSEKYRCISDEVISELVLELQKTARYMIFLFNYKKTDIQDEDYLKINYYRNLPEILALLFHAEWLISPETSFVHLAKVANVKTLAFYHNQIVFGRYNSDSMFGPNFDNAIQISPTSNNPNGYDLSSLPYSFFREYLVKYNILEL